MKMMPLYRFARLVARPLVFPFIPYKVKNRERCPDKGGLIICANHVSKMCIRDRTKPIAG